MCFLMGRGYTSTCSLMFITVLGMRLKAVCVMQAQEFAKVLEPLFKQLAKCLNSSHFQVRHRVDAVSASAVAVQVYGPAAGRPCTV